MSDVSFQEEEYIAPRGPVGARSSRLVTWLIDHSAGLLKTEAQAQLILVICAVLALLFSFYLLSTSSTNEVELVAPPGRVIEYPEDGPPRLRPI